MTTRNYVYDACILCLCLVALAQMAAVTFFNLDESTQNLLFYSDTIICFVFLIDFMYRLIKAPSKSQYFLTWGWLDLVSSIPMVGYLRWARIARVLRIIRVLRGIRASKELSNQMLRNRADSTLIIVSMSIVLILIVSSIAIVQFESQRGGNINSAQDALWWSFATMTTVGYGEKYPVTPEGRILASMLMVAGIGLFGTFTGFVSTKFLQPSEQAQESELQRIEERLALIEKKLDKLIPAID